MTLRRIFIAVEASQEVQGAVLALQREMQAAGVRLRWVRPHQVHFTLRFLGEIPPAQVARAVVGTRLAAAACEPFDICIGGLGAFPTLDRPQVVWIGTHEGGEGFECLVVALEGQLTRQGFLAGGRPFRPHLTLGRSKDLRRWGDLVRALRQYRDARLGCQRVERMTVMESRVTPKGPEYFPVEQVLVGHKLN